jgi:NAD(P)-dependent dehydrogenase (short-subunit alcohol dehydrogenase family)
VTGANSGIGFETARALAQRGADVILACRNPDRAADARDRIGAILPTGSVHVLIVDLGDLDSVASACAEFCTRFKRLDLLVNNAGAILMDEGMTAQGFETHIGINHLGHFALTGGLLPVILATAGSRVVTVSSMGHRAGRIELDSFRGHANYKPMRAYGQSKVANLLFTAELHRRLERAGSTTISLAAHPGGSRFAAGDGQASSLNPIIFRVQGLLHFFIQPPSLGARPTLRAATDSTAEGNDYFGPSGPLQIKGHPVRVGRSKRASDAAMAVVLWDESVRATGVDFAALGP